MLVFSQYSMKCAMRKNVPKCIGRCSHYLGTTWQHRAEAARRAHNPKVGGSNPPVAIITTPQVIEKYLEESNSEG